MRARIFWAAAKGATEAEICQFVGINPDTLQEWKKELEFSDSLKNEKSIVDAKVRNALLSRALGYDFEEEYPTKDGAVMCRKKMHPDVTACIFWLKNRDRKNWRVTEHDDHPDDEKVAKTIVQIFQPIREKEKARINGGEDALDVLLGKEFVQKVKTSGKHPKSTSS